MRKLSHLEIVERQKIRQRQPPIPLVVVLDDIRSLHNVGAVFRTADGAGVEKIYLCGVTGAPPQAQIAKTALGAEERVAWEYRKDASSVVRELKEQGYQIVLLEQTDESVEYDQFVPHGPVCLVVGNEKDGVNEELLSLCDVAMDIHMAGIKNSLNVAVAFGIAAYSLRRHFLKIVLPE